MNKIVGKDIPHDSAVGHVTGESIFLDDVAPLAGELLAGIVPAPVAHGKLKRLDASAAARIPGVAAILTARDVPGHNQFGPVFKDEMLLVEDEITFLGQPLAIIAAENQDALEAARRAIISEVEELPPIFSIDQAIAASSYLGQPRHLQRGDISQGFTDADHRIEGALDVGGQEHFYLESMVAIAIPGEHQTITVHSSTQHPSEVQAMVAEILGIPFNHVVCICKRMGGGFGGKETQAAQPAMMAALLAAKTRRPVRFVYTKDDDMRFTGKRHPFKIVYRARLHASWAHHRRRSPALLQRRLLVRPLVCRPRTSHAPLLRQHPISSPTSTSPAVSAKPISPATPLFRGFGGPQGVAGIENIVEEIAATLGLDSLDIRQHAAATARAIATSRPTVQIIRNNVLPWLFASPPPRMRLRRPPKIHPKLQRRIPPRTSAALPLSPVKFGISFTRRTLNQANALVNIYLDGSVMVSTGATEMGQGVNTRVRQIVAEELGIGYDRVIMAPTSTEKNNNTSPTAASSGTDINGAAAVDACSRLRSASRRSRPRLSSQRAPDGVTAEPQCIHFESGVVFDLRALHPQAHLRRSSSAMRM